MDMTGKRGLITGVANERSYAWHIAKTLGEAGAECLFSCLPGEKAERRTAKAVSTLGMSNAWVMPCDASNDDDLDALFSALATDCGQIDFLVHSIAMADKAYLSPGGFHTTPRHVWTQALDISAYTLVAMARRAVPLMAGKGSILAMSYFGAEKVVPCYNVMGIAKAALEHSARYLAAELGRVGIRVNIISGGPLRTLSAMAIEGFDGLLSHSERTSPLQRNIDGEEVGKTAAYLLSDMGSAVTGETIHVDAGYHVMANYPCQDYWTRAYKTSDGFTPGSERVNSDE
jgi:enoyl-[acyl-carrier protein] reductase I